MSAPKVTRVGDGVYRVEHDGRMETVYVAGPPTDRWVSWKGRVLRRPFADARGTRRGTGAGSAGHTLTAPMPATVLQVLVAAGDAVKQGDTLVLLEAMKMELPIRADADARVRTVSCREGELVQPGATLVELG